MNTMNTDTNLDCARFLERKTQLGSDGAVINGRKGVGVELKTAYYNQAVMNLAEADNHCEQELITL
jgi:hypothetical protein